VDEGEIDVNPMKTISPPTLRDKPVPVVTDDQLTSLLKVCAGKDFQDRRDEAIIRLLLDCGLRVSELCGLTVDGLDLDNGMALVKGKGNKIRPVYFSARTVRAVDRYMRMRAQHRWAHLDALFPDPTRALSTDGARERMNVRAEQAGIDHLHPHQFRHTFAQDFLMAGGQERDLKRLAGWTSDTMLERYGASAADARAKAAAPRLKRGDRV
jgi:site-specific recombinase XerD